MNYKREIIKTIKALEKELGHEIVSGDRKLKLYSDLEKIANSGNNSIVSKKDGSTAINSGGVKSGKWEVEKQRRANLVNV